MLGRLLIYLYVLGFVLTFVLEEPRLLSIAY
jgi:hypothetical protein